MVATPESCLSASSDSLVCFTERPSDDGVLVHDSFLSGGCSIGVGDETDMIWTGAFSATVSSNATARTLESAGRIAGTDESDL